MGILSKLELMAGGFVAAADEWADTAEALSGAKILETIATLGLTIPFATAASLAAAQVPAVVQKVGLDGYTTAYDGGGHVRVRGASGDPGVIQSADGSYWSYLPVNGREIHVKHFGARFNGTTDDTAAINNAIAALVAISGTYTPAASYNLVFPAGRGVTQGGHVVPDTIKVDILGAGRYATILYLKNGANATLFEVSGSYSAIKSMAFDGNRNNNPTGGDCLVVSGSYIKCEDLFIANANTDGIAVGKGDGAINSRYLNIDVRLCKGYGVHVYAATGSTDCQFTDVNVGTSGKSGFNLATGSQKMVNCHSWGNGVEDSTDNHGYRHISGSSMLSGCEAETNLGHGHYIGNGLKSITLNGGTLWGNGNNGVYAYNCTDITITGMSIHDNGVKNSGGSTSRSFANIHLEGCTECLVAANDMYDRGGVIQAGSYSSTPTYPFPGRTAGTYTVSRHYAESTGCNRNIISDNIMRASLTRTGTAIENVGVLNQYRNNNTGITTLRSLAAAASWTMPADVDMIQVTGSTTITSITAAYQGRRIAMIFAANCTVTAGGNLLIGTDFVATAGSVLNLFCDGTNWYRG